MGVLVDLTKCNGCRRCEAACQQAAGFPFPTPQELEDRSVFESPRRPGPRAYTAVNAARSDGDVRRTYVKLNCMHCNDPACVSACLVGAMRKEANGAVTYNAWKCMGCRYCMVACPFQMPTYEYDNVLTPQVRKCTLCTQPGGQTAAQPPACVQACPKECLLYGKRSDLIDRAHEKIREAPQLYVDHVYGEHEAGGTSWLYLSAVPFEQLGFLDLSSAAPPRMSESIQHGVFKYFIPPIAWVGILGLSMWLTRPEQAESPRDSNAASDSAAPARQNGRTSARKREGASV